MSDYTSLSRIQWVELAERFYDQLFEVCESLTSSQWERRTCYIGWSAHNVLAHMATAIPVNFREVLDRALVGNPAAPSEFNTLARNAREVERLRSVPVADLLREMRSEVGKFLSIYRTMTDADWVKPAWFFVGPVNLRTVFLALFADELLHHRDLLLLKGEWRGANPEIAAPLVDWYLRELRPASFRSDRAEGLRASVVYRLSGPSGGEWTLLIDDGKCTSQGGAVANPTAIIAADAEDLFVAAQARAVPWIGMLARRAGWIHGSSHTEDVVATITGVASLGWARLSNRIHIEGDSALASKVNNCFWHFWERTAQTEYNIVHDQATALPKSTGVQPALPQ